ncbi:MAG: co-chaperone GroES [Nanoarchaeota archaeon]
MKIKPLGNRVLLKPIDAEVKTKSGLYIPESAKENPLEAEVVAVGSGEYIDGKLIPISIKAGQKVIYESFGGSEVKIDGIKHKIMDVKDILAIVE